LVAGSRLSYEHAHDRTTKARGRACRSQLLWHYKTTEKSIARKINDLLSNLAWKAGNMRMGC
ncbi:hypothetical protein, partial [Candidatus Accumulibacter vicinus]|uniref:hypothetical protein n=1 Tax=Candidatus Accumulibacter vicinus TaxID=2954382 RepID=UPI00235B6B3E